MVITLKEKTHVDLSAELEKALALARFTAIVERTPRGIKISKVRLKESKPYCGDHAGHCELPARGKPRKANFLEGLDWISLNDGINDILDRFHINADVCTSTCVVRRGTARRVEYYSSDKGGEWEKEGEYVDCCGDISEPSDYTTATPGIYSWS